MDRGAWQATIHGVEKEMDTTERQTKRQQCAGLQADIDRDHTRRTPRLIHLASQKNVFSEALLMSCSTFSIIDKILMSCV